MVRTLIALLLSLLASPAFAQQPAQDEQKAIFDQIIPLAKHCGGDQRCFLDHVGPFGPWLVAIGPRQGAAEPEFASEVLNFGFGIVMAASGAPRDGNGNASLFCGEPCMRTRQSALVKSLDQVRPLALQFGATGLSFIALWPDGRVRADDRVIGAGTAFTADRTPVLGVFRGWDLHPDATLPRDAEVLRIAALMRAAGIVAIARDETGGIRAIHRDSIAENEQGLLFDPRTPPVIGAALANGGRYAWVEQVAPGVFAYIRN